MSGSIDTGEHGPAIIGLLVCAVGWAGIGLEQRRRRRRSAAGLPIFGPAVPPEGADGGTGPVRQPLALSGEVVEHFRSMGPGWQARIDEVLKRHVRDEEARARRGSAEPEATKARVAEEREAWRGEEES